MRRFSCAAAIAEKSIYARVVRNTNNQGCYVNTTRNNARFGSIDTGKCQNALDRVIRRSMWKSRGITRLASEIEAKSGMKALSLF